MRKIVILTVPIILLLLFGAAFLLLEAKRPPAWQDELGQYLISKNSTSSENFSVQNTTKANHPWNFKPEMSQVSFGESAYYQTDFRYEEQPSDYDPYSIIPATSANSSRMPLPYPPTELWCVSLKQEKPSESNHSSNGITIVIVALHQDLYNADYIIHEIASESADEVKNKILAAVDCTFP